MAHYVRVSAARSAGQTGGSTTPMIFSTPAHRRMSVQHQSIGRQLDTTQPYPTECLNFRSSVGSHHEAASLLRLQQSGFCPRIERRVRHEHGRVPALSGLTNRLAALVPTQRIRAAWRAFDSWPISTLPFGPRAPEQSNGGEREHRKRNKKTHMVSDIRRWQATWADALRGCGGSAYFTSFLLLLPAGNILTSAM